MSNTADRGTMDFDPNLFGVEGVPGNTNQVANQGQEGQVQATSPDPDPRSPEFTNQMVKFLEDQLTGDEGAPGVKPDETAPPAPPDNQPQTQEVEEPTLTQQQIDAIEALEKGDEVAGQVESQDQETTTTPPDPTQQQQIDLNALAQQVYGRPLSQDEAVNFMLFARDIEQLNPQQRAALQQTLYGGGNDVQYQTPQPQTQQPAPVQPPAPVPQVLPTDLDPEIVAALNPIVAQVQQVAQQNQILQQYVLNQAAQSQQTQIAQVQTTYENTKSEWFEKHPNLTPEERAAFEVQLRSTNVLPSQFQAHNQDAAAAMNATLDQFYWSNPVIRDREIENAAKTRRVEDAQQAKKQAKSTALAGPGGAPVKSPSKAAAENGRDPIAAWVDQFMSQQ